MRESRRKWFGRGLAALAATIAGCGRAARNREPASVPARRARIAKIGTSFSISHAEWMNGKFNGPDVGQPWEESLKAALPYFRVIRLSVPWNEVEVAPGKFDMSRFEKAIALCAKAKVPVILCLGGKTPRWPELYVPKWYLSRLEGKEDLDAVMSEVLTYMTAVLAEYGNDPRIEAFQIENEPREKVGSPNLIVSPQMLEYELANARTLTKKPLILTMGAGMTDDGAPLAMRFEYLDQLLAHKPDRIGFNIYQKGFWKGHGFEGSPECWAMVKEMVQRAKAAGVEPFIAELQAEPWEEKPDKVDFHTADGNASLQPATYREVVYRAEELGCDEALLWGWEFQHACANQGNRAWLASTRTLIRGN